MFYVFFLLKIYFGLSYGMCPKIRLYYFTLSFRTRQIQVGILQTELIKSGNFHVEIWCPEGICVKLCVANLSEM